MFNLQGGEIIIIVLLALVVLGPEKLPDAMRKAGRMYAELRKMSSGFQEEFRKAAEPFQQSVNEVSGQVRDTANLLRDSADFTKLSSGERDEKPKSAEMAAATPSAPEAPEMPDIPLVATAGPTEVTPGAAPSFTTPDRPEEPADGTA